jgi:23S rRNA (guanine2445-N2)-methyltransferase / 23S rRNA (guanine2069-N7)-methyltransferase
MAVAGGASQAVSVDVSNTYLNWGRENMKLNRQDVSAHSFIRSDSSDFLRNNSKEFDLIFIDPPTYSNGNGRSDWSVQDDHAALITLAMEQLNPRGVLIFAENFRRFSLDPELGRLFSVKDITRETTDPDFIRRNGAHRCWEITHRSRN